MVVARSVADDFAEAVVAPGVALHPVAFVLLVVAGAILVGIRAQGYSASHPVALVPVVVATALSQARALRRVAFDPVVPADVVVHTANASSRFASSRS